MPEYRRKFSPATKLRLSEIPDGESPVLSLLVRVDPDVGPQELTQLEAVGAELRTVAGDVITLDLPLCSLSELASLDIVLSIDVSTPLFLEPGEDGPDTRRDAHCPNSQVDNERRMR